MKTVNYRTLPCGICKQPPSAHTILGLGGTRKMFTTVKPHGFKMGETG